MATLTLAILSLAMLPGAYSSPSGPAYVRLKSSAALSGAYIRLFDLLPEEAPLDLKKAGQGVIVGSSPQAGSQRVLHDSEVLAKLDSKLRSRISVPDRMYVSRTSWPLDRQLIGRAVSGFLRQRWPEENLLNPENLSWPSEIVTPGPLADIEITSLISSAQPGELVFTARCTDVSQCRSFVVRGHMEEGVVFSGRIAHRSQITSIAYGKNAPLSVRPGSKATLTLEQDGIRAFIRVTCLDRGRVGDVVRVHDSQLRRPLRAIVVGENYVRASLMDYRNNL